MPDEDEKPTASGVFSVPAWGPKKLRASFKKIVNRINQITPKEGIGIVCDETPAGTQISLFSEKHKGGTSSGPSFSGGSAGTNIDIYGAHAGAPAIFHLVQTASPDPIE